MSDRTSTARSTFIYSRLSAWATRILCEEVLRNADRRANYRTLIVLSGTLEIYRALDKIFPASQVPALCRREWHRFRPPLLPLRRVHYTASWSIRAESANSLSRPTFDKCLSASRPWLANLAKVRRPPKRSLYRVRPELHRTCLSDHRPQPERNARKRSSDPFRSLSESGQSLDRTGAHKDKEDLTGC